MSYLALGLVAGLAAVERKGFLQAMLSRPAALGPLAGLAAGDVQAGLLVGAPLELLWLGAVNLGAALPVHEALGTAAVAGAAALAARAAAEAGLSGPALLPAVAALAVALCAPLAVVGRGAERATEDLNDRLYARAERALAARDPAAAARANLYGLALPFAVAFALAPLGAAAGAALIPWALLRAPSALAPLALAWVAFAGFACAAGARSLRARAAPRAFLGALAGGLVLVAAVAFVGART